MKRMMHETQEEYRDRLALADRLAEFDVLSLHTRVEDFNTEIPAYFDLCFTTEKEAEKYDANIFDAVLQDACNEAERRYWPRTEQYDEEGSLCYHSVVRSLQIESKFQTTDTRRQTVELLTDMRNFITQYGNGFYSKDWPEIFLDCTKTEFDFGNLGKYDSETKTLEFGKYFADNYSEANPNLKDILRRGRHENGSTASWEFYDCMRLAETVKLPSVPTLYAGTVRYENNNRKSGDDVWALNVKNLIVDSETTEIESGTVFIQDTDEGSTLEQVYLQDSAENVPNDAFQKIILSVPERHRGDMAESVLHIEDEQAEEKTKSPAD